MKPHRNPKVNASRENREKIRSLLSNPRNKQHLEPYLDNCSHVFDTLDEYAAKLTEFMYVNAHNLTLKDYRKLLYNLGKLRQYVIKNTAENRASYIRLLGHKDDLMAALNKKIIGL